MKRTSKKVLVLLLALTLTVSLLAGCQTAAESEAAPAESEAAMSEAAGSEVAMSEATGDAEAVRGPIVVSSKDFTEALFYGEITKQYLESLGYEVEDRMNLGPTPICRTAIKGDEIDLYWDYTNGVIQTEELSEAMLGYEESYEFIKEYDAENYDILWGAPTEVNTAYVLMASGPFAEENDLVTISDVKAMIEAGEPVRTFFGLETWERSDGIAGLMEHYDFEFDESLLTTGMTGLDHEALANDEADIAMGLATQGQIASFGHVVLEDDMGFFSTYMPSYMVRGEIAEAYPTLMEEMDVLCPLLNDEVLQQVNLEVEVDGRSVQEVATEFLTENGLI